MIERQDFADSGELARALAGTIHANLEAGIKERGVASIAVSGGSTPALFFETLAKFVDLDWSAVTITLVDERWVDDSSDRSNARLVKQKLLKGPARNAHFVPLFAGGDAPDATSIADTNAMQHAVPHPFDAVILGMGNDGHTASFFPGGDALDEALTATGPALAISAPGAGEARVTLTLPHLLATSALYLHIEGAAKAQTLVKALEDGPINEMPVRAVLRQTQKPVNIYWCA